MNSYLYIVVEDRNINRFLLNCNKKNINIIKIKYVSYKKIIILINEKDLKKLKRISYCSKITIIKKGLSFIKEIIKKYNYFIIICILGLFLLIFLSNIIFDIEIVTDNNELKNIIIKELKNNNIEKYKFIKSYKQIEKIKKNIIKKYRNNIEWIEITRYGTKYIVNIVERKVNNISFDDKIYSLVATKSGIVRGIFVEKGISLVEKGNYIKKGDILVSSDIFLRENIKNRISVKGKVYGETWYRVNVEYPLNYIEKKYTSNKRKIPYFRIGNRYIELFKYKNFDRNKSIIYKDNIGNIEFGIEDIREVIIINDKYSIKEALNKSIDKAREKINMMLDDGEYILSENTLNFYDNGSKIIVDIFFSVYEEIGELKELEMGE